MVIHRKKTGGIVIGSPTWIDEVLSDSFPASDPPSWIPGVVRPAPAKSDPGEVTADGLEDEIGIKDKRPGARYRQQQILTLAIVLAAGIAISGYGTTTGSRARRVTFA